MEAGTGGPLVRIAHCLPLPIVPWVTVGPLLPLEHRGTPLLRTCLAKIKLSHLGIRSSLSPPGEAVSSVASQGSRSQETEGTSLSRWQLGLLGRELRHHCPGYPAFSLGKGRLGRPLARAAPSRHPAGFSPTGCTQCPMVCLPDWGQATALPVWVLVCPQTHSQAL